MGLASLAMFTGGAFSAAPLEPLRVDADVLANFAVADLERGMQVSDVNPLVGMDGRVDLLRRLGRLVASKPDIFGSRDTPRPGGLFDRLAMLADGRKAARADDPSGTAATTRADLAIAADAGRRSRSATAGGIRR